MVDTAAALSHGAFTVLPLQNQPKMAAAITIGAKLYAAHNVTSKALVETAVMYVVNHNHAFKSGLMTHER